MSVVSLTAGRPQTEVTSKATRRRFAELTGKRPELLVRLLELDLQLPGVDPLGLRDVDAPAKQLDPLLELLLGAPQLVALGGYPCPRDPCLCEPL
jgi:hypothetical protein